MKELVQKEIRIEESKPSITDAEIRDEKKRLETLTKNGKDEIERIDPDISFEKIMGLPGNPVESEEQYNLAIKYFTDIQDLAKSGKLYSQNLYLEKLRNPDKDPESIEKSFKKTSEDREKKYQKLNKDTKNLIPNSPFINSYKWDKFLTASKSGKATNQDKETFRKKIEKQQLILDATIPDYYREAVRYVPSLVKEAIDSVKENYNITWQKRATLRNSIPLRQKRIKEFMDLGVQKTIIK